MKKFDLSIGAVAIVVGAVMLLNGCAGFSEQKYAGLTEFTIEKCEASDAPCKLVVKDGKERKSVSLTAKIGEATLAYSADEELAFRAHEIRAAVEAALIEKTGQVIPGVADAVVRAMLGSAGISALASTVQGAGAASAAIETAKIKADVTKATLGK